MQACAKVVLIGATNVGKTCIVTRATTNFYDPEQTSTVGASFSVKEYEVDGNKATLRIWDTAGQEKFRSLAPMYFQGSQVALLVFSVDSLSSFDEIDIWYEEIKSALTEMPVMYLIGNKSDLEDKRVVSFEEGQRKSDMLKAIYFETSAKLGHNIEELFLSIAESVLAMKREEESSKVSLSAEPHLSTKGSGGCC